MQKNTQHFQISRKIGRIHLKDVNDGIKLSFTFWLMFFITRGIIFVGTILAGWNPLLRADDPLDLLLFPILVLITIVIIMLGIFQEAICDNTSNSEFKVTVSLTNLFKKECKAVTISLSTNNIIHAIIFTLGVILFLIGHGMRWTANYLNFTATNEGIHVSNPDFYEEIWFFDEILGHWLLFSGFWLLILSVIVMNVRFPSRKFMTKKELVIWSGLALMGSTAWVLTSIEGAYATWGLMIGIMIILGTILFFFFFYAHKNREYLKRPCLLDLMHEIISKYKMLFFLAMFSTFSILQYIIYFFAFGGQFIQPSELGVFDRLRELLRDLM